MMSVQVVITRRDGTLAEVKRLPSIKAAKAFVKKFNEPDKQASLGDTE